MNLLLFLFFQSSDSPVPALICCGAPIIIIVVILIQMIKSSNEQFRKNQELLRQKKLELEQAKTDYHNSLEWLKKKPTNADIKQNTLKRGRHYSELTRQFHNGDKTITIYDEMALMNDINAVCAGASATTNTKFTDKEPVEERLTKLSALKEKSLISEDEYQKRRQKILDEI